MTPTKTITLTNNLDAIIAAIIGAAIIYYFTTIHGIGISPDSLTYTSVARNMQLGRFWYQFDNMPLIVFPCFYPSLLGGIMFISHHDILTIAPSLNATLFGCTIFLSGCIVQQLAPTAKLYKWLLLSVIILSSSLIEIYSMLWSETLFILLLLLFIIALHKYATNRSFKQLIIVAIIAAIACITRFAGVTFIAITGLILLIDSSLKWHKKWWHMIVFGLISISLLVSNLLYNYHLVGTLTGDRQKSLTPFTTNFQFYSNVMWDWLKLPEGRYTYAAIIGVALLLAFTAIIIKRWWYQQDIDSYPNIAAATFVIYVVFIVATASISRYEQINNRLFSAAYIPLLLASTFWLPSTIGKLATKPLRYTATAASLAIASLFQFQQYHWVSDWRGMVINYGIPGYTDATWQQSPIVQYLQQHHNNFKPSIPIYANANDAVYFFSGLSCETVPEAAHYQEIKNYYNEQPHYIVWFTNEFDNPNILRLQALQQYRHLDTLQTFSDGYILMSTKKK